MESNDTITGKASQDLLHNVFNNNLRYSTHHVNSYYLLIRLKKLNNKSLVSVVMHTKHLHIILYNDASLDKLTGRNNKNNLTDMRAPYENIWFAKIACSHYLFKQCLVDSQESMARPILATFLFFLT